MRSPIAKPQKNILQKLAHRELSRLGNRSFDRSNAAEKFRGYQLAHAPLDTHDPKASHLRLSFLKKRSKITEIVAAKEIIFALAASGVCVAFLRSPKGAFSCSRVRALPAIASLRSCPASFLACCP